MVEKKPILQIINEIAAADDPSPVVLPLMCGAGKSQAISEKIGEAIRDNKGLLVITDRVSRLEKYIDNDHNPILREYLKEHSDQYVILKGKSITSDRKKSHYCPVLLMTTQRYFSLGMEEIREYLSWGEHDEHKRRLVLIDEKPELYFQCDLSLSLLNQFETAFVDSVNMLDLEARLNILQYWSVSTGTFINHWISMNNLFPQMKQYMLITGYDNEQEKDLLITEGMSPDDIEFVENANGFVHAHFDPQENFRKFILQNRYSIYQASKIDPVKIFHAFQLYNDRCRLYCSRSQSNGGKARYYSTIENQKPKLTDIDAKVIILDATADISFDYQQDYLRFDFEDCRPYERKIPNLHIKLVKHQFSRKRAKTVTMKEFERFESFVKAYSGEESICIFTYKTLLETLAADFDGDDETGTPVRRDYLGNLKGRNDFQEYNVFVQVGLNYRPPSYYLSILIEQDPKLRETLLSPENFQNLGDVRIIEEFMESDTYKSAVLNDLLADIEQNIFRSRIRDANYDGDIQYYLFFDYDLEINRGLKELIYDRFQRKYGADIECIDPTPYMSVQKVKNRKQKKGPTNPQKVYAFLESLEDASVFGIDILLSETQLTQQQFNKVKENDRFLREYLKECRVQGRRGAYIKKPMKDSLLS